MKFRQWFNQQLLAEEEKDSKIRHFLDTQGLILFFKKDKDYFGADEDGRVVFARLKDPDDETPSGWADEATFSAANLSKMVQGQPSTHIFSKNDIKKIKVVDRDKVIDSLKDTESDGGVKMSAIRIVRIGHSFDGQHDRDDAPNFVRADEE